jgi:hypothetical protein
MSEFPIMRVDRSRSFSDQSPVAFTAFGRTVLPQKVKLAFDFHEGLAGRTVQTVGRNAPLARHGNPFLCSNYVVTTTKLGSQTPHCRPSAGIRRTADRRQVSAALPTVGRYRNSRFGKDLFQVGATGHQLNFF